MPKLFEIEKVFAKLRSVEFYKKIENFRDFLSKIRENPKSVSYRQNWFYRPQLLKSSPKFMVTPFVYFISLPRTVGMGFILCIQLLKILSNAPKSGFFVILLRNIFFKQFEIPMVYSMVPKRCQNGLETVLASFVNHVIGH